MATLSDSVKQTDIQTHTTHAHTHVHTVASILNTTNSPNTKPFSFRNCRAWQSKPNPNSQNTTCWRVYQEQACSDCAAHLQNLPPISYHIPRGYCASGRQTVLLQVNVQWIRLWAGRGEGHMSQGNIVIQLSKVICWCAE